MPDTQPTIRPVCKHCGRTIEQWPDTWVPNRFNWVHSTTGYGDCGDKGEAADTYATPTGGE
jgi:hypothetical protein